MLLIIDSRLAERHELHIPASLLYFCFECERVSIRLIAKCRLEFFPLWITLIAGSIVMQENLFITHRCKECLE